MLKNSKAIYKGLFILLTFVLLSCQTKLHKQQAGTSKAALKDEEIILDKKFFKVGFNPKYRMANWVEYTLEAKNLKSKVAKRNNNFHSDQELLKIGRASMAPNDLVGTDYDKGHLAPSADFAWSQEANDATFVMSNMAPQYKRLNRQAWRYLEERVRGWACTEKELKIITGVIFDQDMKRLPNSTFIPKRFYKIVLDKTPPRKSIAFIYNQNDIKDVYKERVFPLKQLRSAANVEGVIELNSTNTDYPESKLTEWKESACN